MAPESVADFQRMPTSTDEGERDRVRHAIGREPRSLDVKPCAA
jgi:hypothetical protein